MVHLCISSGMRHHRSHHLRRDGRRQELHARLGAQLPLLELRPRLRGRGHDVRDGGPLPGGGEDHAEEGDRQGHAGEAAVPHGEECVEKKTKSDLISYHLIP